MKKLQAILIIILFFLLFLVFEIKKEKYYKVLEVIEGDKICLDFNSDSKCGSDEIIHLKNINTFPLKYSAKIEEYVYRYGLTPKEVLILGHAAKIYTKTLIEGQEVSITGHLPEYNPNYSYRFAEILFNGKNFGEILLENGLGVAYESKNSRGFNPYKTFENIKKIKTRAKEFKNLKLPDDIVFPDDTNTGLSSKSYFKPPQNVFNKSLKKTFSGVTIFLSNPNSYSKPSFMSRTEASRALINNINASKNTIDFALFGIDGQNEILNALLEAKKRGVAIRGVVDSKSSSNNDFIYAGTLKLIQNFNTVSDMAPPLMHNKFFIFDSKKVLSGTMNVSTTGSGGYNANTTVIIDNETVAQIYKQEFNQMFDGKFRHSKENFSKMGLQINPNTELDIIFSPEGQAFSRISSLIRNSKKEIFISIFYLTHRGIIEELIAARKRGVDVKIIYDAVGANNMKTKVDYLRNQGVKVKVENWGGKNHEKNMVIDSKYFITGSANFSNSGMDKNDENILIFKNDEIAKFYRDYFLKLYNSIDDKYLKFIPRAESFESVNSCYDGIDNNFDGRVDSEDAGCKR